MPIKISVYYLVLFLFTAACSGEEPQTSGGKTTRGSWMDSTLQDDLALVKSAKVYFNHMSVGDNVLAGLEGLDKEFQTILLHDSDKNVEDLGPSFFAHSMLGQNGAPKIKIDAFVRYVDEKMPRGVDVALMKLCYVDIDTKTDVVDLFSYYKTAIARLEAKHPQIAFVHVTVPLRVKYAQAAWKDFIKGLIGWNDDVARANIRRAVYSDFIRRQYPLRRIFDLASIESTRPDGTRESFERYGVSYPSLYPGYTNDNGHLHGQIQQHAAREMIRTLAGVLREKGALAK
jgi:hypothetical protein